MKMLRLKPLSASVSASRACSLSSSTAALGFVHCRQINIGVPVGHGGQSVSDTGSYYHDTVFTSFMEESDHLSLEQMRKAHNWRRHTRKNPVEMITATVSDYLLHLPSDSQSSKSKMVAATATVGAANELEGLRQLGTFSMAEFGCGDGLNSLVPVSTAIQALRRLEKQDPDITTPTAVRVSHVDTNIDGGPYGARYRAWHSLFHVVNHMEYGYAQRELAVYPSAIASRTLFERLFPAQSLDFAFSMVGLHNLSALPFDESQCGACLLLKELYAEASDDDSDKGGVSNEQWKLIRKQSADDLRAFLRHRAAELKHGGRMLLCFLGGNGTEERGLKPSKIPALFEYFLRENGLSQGGVVPMHFRTVDEIRSVISEVSMSRVTVDDSGSKRKRKKDAHFDDSGEDKEEEVVRVEGGGKQKKLFELDVMWEDVMVHPAFRQWQESKELTLPSGAKGDEEPEISWKQCVEAGVEGMQQSLSPFMLRFVDEDLWEGVCQRTKQELEAEEDSDSFAVNLVYLVLTRTDLDTV